MERGGLFSQLEHSSYEQNSYFFFPLPSKRSQINYSSADHDSQSNSLTSFSLLSPFYPSLIHKVMYSSDFTQLGCCLLVDISGFTILSSKLCSIGSIGIDTLRKIIDNSFATFVRKIHQYGGEGKYLCYFSVSPFLLFLSLSLVSIYLSISISLCFLTCQLFILLVIL